MKLLLNSLLFASFCALSSWSGSSDTLMVAQIPDVSVMEGGTVNISCCWTGSAVSQRLRVIWLKNLKEIKNEAVNLTSPLVKKEGNDCRNLTLSSATKEDTGSYICRVTAEIPVLASANGSGTVLTVTSRGNTTTDGETAKDGDITTPIIAAVAVMALLLLLTLTCYCSLRRKQAQVARVIYEVPHIDSEMDKHSTSSSRGSTQWCQVPVYESFDYFERVQTKEAE